MNRAEQTAEHQLQGPNRLPATAAVVAFALATIAVGLAVRNDDEPIRQTTSATVVAQPATSAPASPTTVPEAAPAITSPPPMAGATTVPKPATTLAPKPAATPDTSRPPAATSLDSESRLRVDGVGPVRIGMTLDQVRTAAGVAMVRRDGGVCVGYQTDGAPAGLHFTAVEGSNRLDFITVSEPSIATVSGIRVGSAVAEVRRTYGESLKGSVEDGWGKLVFRAADPSLDRFAMAFLVSDGKVAGIWSGLRTIVEQDEICA